MIVVKSFKELGRVPKPGDRVMIVSERVGRYWNPEGKMDKYLGAVMTVRNSSGTNPERYTAAMHEDINDQHGGWCWSPHMIEGLVIETPEEIDEDPSVWTTGFSISDLLT